MTRINPGVPVQELCNDHVLAEYREMTRVWPYAQRYTAEGKDQPPPRLNQPGEFKLGAGHVLFFVNRGAYLKRRWLALRSELEYRRHKPTLDWRPWPADLDGDWQPGPRETLIMRARIINRLATMKPKWTRRTRPDWAIEEVRL